MHLKTVVRRVLLKHKEPLLAACIYILLWGGIQIHTNYIPSGYHFQEDHEIIDGMEEIKQFGFMNATSTAIINNLEGRFRPFYLAFRYTCFYLFGLNFSYWHILFDMILLGLSLISFRIGRMLGLSFFAALSFPLILTTGSVSEAITRIGACELYGAFFSAAAFYFILKSVTTTTHKFLFEVVTHFFVFLACCSKESFILLIPVFIAIKLFSDYNFNKHPAKAVITKNKTFIVCEFALLLFCAAVIKFHFSKQAESIYGGFDGDIKKAIQLLADTLSSGLNLEGLISGTGIYMLYILLGFIILLAGNHLSSSSSRSQSLLFYTVIFFYISATQYLMHYKISLEGYYLLPFMFGPSLVLCLLADLISEHFGKIGKIFSVIFILILIIIKTTQTYAQFKTYSDEGTANEELIQTVIITSKTNSRILISGDELLHMEHFYALSKYFNYFSREPIQLSIQLLPADEKMFMSLSKTNDASLLPIFKNIVHKHFRKNLYTGSPTLKNYDVILVLPYCKNRFLKTNNADTLVTFYDKKTIGKEWFAYTLYIKSN